MSGPYRCTMCAGSGMVEVGFDDNYERCPECKGSGETHPESNSPSLEQLAFMMKAGVPLSDLPSTKAQADEWFAAQATKGSA